MYSVTLQKGCIHCILYIQMHALFSYENIFDMEMLPLIET